MALFAEKGYQRTTLIGIGRRAGCTGTLISNRFGSKERLLRAVLAHILNRFEADESLRPADEDRAHLPAAEQLSSFVAAYLEDVAKEGTRIRALYVLMGEALGSLPEITEEIAHVNQVFREEIIAYLRLGMARGEFPADTKAPLLATLIVGLLRGVAMQILIDGAQTPLADLIAASQRAVRSMVLEKGAAAI